MMDGNGDGDDVDDDDDGNDEDDDDDDDGDDDGDDDDSGDDDELVPCPECYAIIGQRFAATIDVQEIVQDRGLAVYFFFAIGILEILKYLVDS